MSVLNMPTSTARNIGGAVAPPARADVSGVRPKGRSVAERIRERAYEIYRTRSASGGTGDAISDWVQAERELSGLAEQPSAVPGARFTPKA